MRMLLAWEYLVILGTMIGITFLVSELRWRNSLTTVGRVLVPLTLSVGTFAVWLVIGLVVRWVLR